jgi:hypothetical protein
MILIMIKMLSDKQKQVVKYLKRAKKQYGYSQI